MRLSRAAAAWDFLTARPQMGRGAGLDPPGDATFWGAGAWPRTSWLEALTGPARARQLRAWAKEHLEIKCR